MKHTKKKLIFKNKKAVGNDVDWIIAMGIFLIYLVMTLVYFKPGVKPVFNPQNLLDIVDENFHKTAYWEVITQPMFVSRLECKNLTAVPCPTFNNYQIFEFKGEHNQSVDNITVNQITPAVSPLNDLIKNNANTQIFFVKPNVSITIVSGEATITDRTAEENPASLPTKENLRGGYTAKGCEKCECEIGGSDREQCREYRQRGHNAENCDPETNQTLISECRTILEQISQVRAQEGRARPEGGAQPTQENPVAPNEINQTEFRDGYIRFNTTGGNLRMKPYFNGYNKTKYLITVSDRKINDLTSLPGSQNISTPNSYNGSCLITNYAPTLKVSPSTSPPCYAKYELGVAETLKGIYLPGIDSYVDLTCEDDKKGYECVKLMWGYPELKEFKIKVYTPDQKSIAEFPKEPIVPTNVNIYSRQYNTFILNDDGLKKPVTVSILVW